MSNRCHFFKISFYQKDTILEIYAEEVTESDMYGFIVVEGILFAEPSAVLLDPAEEKLKQLFANVKRTYIPIHAVIRIDEVEKIGTAKLKPTQEKETGKITPFSVIPPSHPKK